MNDVPATPVDGTAGQVEMAQPRLLERRMVAVAADVSALKESVRTGQLVLDPAAGQQLQSALADQMDLVDHWLQRAQNLAQRPQLGRNPVGDAMAAKFQNRAGGEDLSLTGVLTPFRKVLQDAHDAVRDAMASYQGVEQQNVDHLHRLL